MPYARNSMDFMEIKVHVSHPINIKIIYFLLCKRYRNIHKYRVSNSKNALRLPPYQKPR